MARRQHYGIKFPITANSFENTFFDLNQKPDDDIKSQIMHLIFTPVGQRLRRPNFGSRLIQFIFNPNEAQSWGDVVSDIKTMVAANIKNCNINDIEIYEAEDGRGLIADIAYEVFSGGKTVSDRIITNL